MARIDDLLLRIPDPQLRAELSSAVAEVRRTTDFGLVYESHLPETCRLPSYPIRRGVKVTLRFANDASLYLVASVNGTTAKLVPLRGADGVALGVDDQVPVERPPSELVVVAEFGDPIYPGLKRVGSLSRGGDKPAHVVINGENHHALEALQFTHAGKVDCVYIDPPYNTGARDWKYNNDYVDDADIYKHSKWLAFIERRLTLAKALLNPADSVLIVTIDEKEYLRLGLLLEQVFPAARIQMVDVLINPAVVARAGSFGRSDEYVFFVMLGRASPDRVRLPREWVSSKGRTHTGNVRWDLLRRSGPNAARSDRPGLFYPIYVNPDGPRISAVGEPLPVGVHEAPPMDGLVAVLPIRKDRSEGNWQAKPSTLRERIAEGRVRVTGSSERGFTISVLKTGEFQKVLRGEFEVVGSREDGSLIVADSDTEAVMTVPGSQWRIAAHDATQYGSRLLQSLLPGRRFPFPKSLYAVEDALRFFVANKPSAVIVDFFAGSGTTTHAVARLNHQDGGRRQSIIVTNNDVSADEAKSLTERGFRDGDPEWEALGIFEHVTRPRIEAAITGRTLEGRPVKGEYKFVDEFPLSDGLDENVEFFELTYQDAAAIKLDLAFGSVAPLLWLRAGGHGAMIEHHAEAGFAWANRYGVLWDTDRWQAFVGAAPETATTAFVVTDSATAFAAVVSELPAGVEPVRLYENYLTTFAINQVQQE